MDTIFTNVALVLAFMKLLWTYDPLRYTFWILTGMVAAFGLFYWNDRANALAHDRQTSTSRLD